MMVTIGSSTRSRVGLSGGATCHPLKVMGWSINCERRLRDCECVCVWEFLIRSLFSSLPLSLFSVIYKLTIVLFLKHVIQRNRTKKQRRRERTKISWTIEIKYLGKTNGEFFGEHGERHIGELLTFKVYVRWASKRWWDMSWWGKNTRSPSEKQLIFGSESVV